MSNQFRNRRHIALQMGGLIDAAEKLVANKGKHQGHFERFDPELQQAFLKVIGFNHTVLRKYEIWLQENDEDNLPEYLASDVLNYRKVLS